MDDAESTRAANVADSESDQTAAISNTKKTVSEELAWSAATDEQETEASEKHSRALWLGPVMALLAAAIAVASVLLFYLERSSRPKPPTPTPPSATASPAPPTPTSPPPLPTSTTPLTTTTTTSTTSAAASGPALGQSCNDWSKIARDTNTGLTIICDGATGAGARTQWTTFNANEATGIPETIGTSCEGFQPFTMAISPDDYLVACFPTNAGGQVAGPGSKWKIFHP